MPNWNDTETIALEAISDISHYSSSGWGRTNCPFCEERVGSPDYKNAFGYNEITNFFHCFKCLIKGFVGDPNFDSALLPPPKDKFDPPESYEEIAIEPCLSSMFMKPKLKYLSDRGLSEEVVRQAHIGWCQKGKFASRIIVPILDEKEYYWKGWSARLFGPESKYKPKYLYPEGMDKRNLLYNSAALEKDPDKPLIVVEGVFDALPLWPLAVACLGKPSDSHLDLLCSTKRRIIVCLDGDAWREGRALAQRLALRGKNADYLRLPPKEDPCTIGRTNILKMIEEL
jgi:hypothetical protein